MEILVVHKKSKYELYRDSDDPATRKFARNNPEYIRSHEMNKRTLEAVATVLTKLGNNFEIIYRADLTEIKDKDLVIAVGGDGTFLEISHYVKDIPILGINSDSETSIGFFSACNKDTFEQTINNIKTTTEVNRLKIMINDRPIKELALNDVLYAHANPGSTSRYEMQERYKNSGLLVCTGVGSTARMYQEGGKTMLFDSPYMEFHHKSLRNSGFHYARDLQLTSLTRQGILFIDGPHLQYTAGLGTRINITTGNPLTIIGDLYDKRFSLDL